MIRPVLFLSDYGLADEFVGVCHAVIARIAPDVRVINITHSIPPQSVARGALVLAGAAPYAPPGSVFLAIVDPGVGTARRPLVVDAGEALLVGPDNGVLSLAWEALGGADRAFEIASPEVVLTPISDTFHGRDMFAPAAAHLAAGLAPDRMGPEVDRATLARVEVPTPKVEPGHVHCSVIGADRFGNLQLSTRMDDLRQAGIAELGELEVRCAGRSFPVPRVKTFGDVAEGQYAALVDSSGWLALVQNKGSAAESLAVRVGEPVVVGAPGRTG